MKDDSDSKYPPPLARAPQPEAKQVEAAPAEPAAPAAPKRTPEDWAERLGHINKANKNLPQSKTHADWQHAAADKLHNWSKYAFHFQAEPFLLSQEDYELALIAGAEYPNTPAHKSALALPQKENA